MRFVALVLAGFKALKGRFNILLSAPDVFSQQHTGSVRIALEHGVHQAAVRLIFVVMGHAMQR
jgi:hypothetical protein